MTTTVNRPAPLPPRPGQAIPAVPRATLPAGAVAMRRSYLDRKGVPQRSEYLVPVDIDDRRTEHIRYACRGHVEIDGVKQDCGQVAWLLPGDGRRFCPDHGCELTREGGARREPWLPWGLMWKSVEPSARPLWVLLAEAAAGIGVHAGHVPWWAPLAAAPVLAGGAYGAAGLYLTRRAVRGEKIEKGQKSGRRVDTIRRRARMSGYTGAAAGAWLTAAAATDPASPANVAVWASLPLAWAVASAPWWRRVNEQKARQVPGQEAVAVAGPAVAAVDPQARKDATDWATEVAQSGGLPNTAVDLNTWQADAGGRRMVIRARRGALTDEKIRMAVPLIAAAFDVKMSAIGWVAEYEDSPRAVLLLVQPNSPLNENVTWEPVDVVDAKEAVAHIGTRIDGSRLVTRLWTPNWGAPSRLILGTKGSGKTEYLRLLLLIMLKARVVGAAGPRRLVAPFLHDPKRGKDFGAFRRQVAGFSTTSDCLHMVVEALIREMDRRYDALGSSLWFDDYGRPREGETAFDPSIHGPIISLVIDELHEPAKDQALLAKLEPMARKMRAAGIEVVGATHKSTLDDTGTQGFRDMLAGGEATLFRTTLGLNGALATGGTLTGDPRALPRVPGMNLHASGEEDTMQARMAYVEPEALYNMLYDEANRSLIQPVEWPRETLDAFGSEFVGWMGACQARRPGDPAPPTPKPVAESVVVRGTASAGEASSALEALRRIAFEATAPFARPHVTGHPAWGSLNVTSTLTKALKDATDAKWLVKLASGGGLYEMTAEARGRMRAERSEQLALKLDEAGE